MSFTSGYFSSGTGRPRSTKPSAWRVTTIVQACVRGTAVVGNSHLNEEYQGTTALYGCAVGVLDLEWLFPSGDERHRSCRRRPSRRCGASGWFHLFS